MNTHYAKLWPSFILFAGAVLLYMGERLFPETARTVFGIISAACIIGALVVRIRGALRSDMGHSPAYKKIAWATGITTVSPTVTGSPNTVLTLRRSKNCSMGRVDWVIA